jgi:hypothetical protein
MIPLVEEMLIGRKALLKKVIIIGTLIPLIIYMAFVFLVLGLSGSFTTQSAIIGLRYFVGYWAFMAALFVGVAATFTAFISQGLFLNEIFRYDMGIKRFPAWALTCFVPFTLFLLGFNSFIPLMSFIGGVFLGINGIFILLIYKKIGGSKFVIYPLMLVFMLGIVYSLVYFVK